MQRFRMNSIACWAGQPSLKWGLVRICSLCEWILNFIIIAQRFIGQRSTARRCMYLVLSTHSLSCRSSCTHTHTHTHNESMKEKQKQQHRRRSWKKGRKSIETETVLVVPLCLLAGWRDCGLDTRWGRRMKRKGEGERRGKEGGSERRV